MLIKGVRSFSPDNTTVIEFYKPLTLIVGANGAGKTVRARRSEMGTGGETEGGKAVLAPSPASLVRSGGHGRVR
jgi:predicted ATPase